MLVLTIWPPVWRCCCWWNMAESSDSPLLAQYLLENIIMAGCILGTGSGPGFSTWDEAMGNQWVYEYQGSSLLFCCCALTLTLGDAPSVCRPDAGPTPARLRLNREREGAAVHAPPPQLFLLLCSFY